MRTQKQKQMKSKLIWLLEAAPIDFFQRGQEHPHTFLQIRPVNPSTLAILLSWNSPAACQREFSKRGCALQLPVPGCEVPITGPCPSEGCDTDRWCPDQVPRASTGTNAQAWWACITKALSPLPAILIAHIPTQWDTPSAPALKFQLSWEAQSLPWLTFSFPFALGLSLVCWNKNKNKFLNTLLWLKNVFKNWKKYPTFQWQPLFTWDLFTSSLF